MVKNTKIKLNVFSYENFTLNKVTYLCDNSVIKKIKENHKVVKLDSEYYVSELPFYDGLTKWDNYFSISVKDILNNFNYFSIEDSIWTNLNNYFKFNYGVGFSAYSFNSGEYDTITLLLNYETDDDYKEFCNLYKNQKKNCITDIILHFLFSERMYECPVYINIVSFFDDNYYCISKDYKDEDNPFKYTDYLFETPLVL